MGYSAKAIANYFLELAAKESEKITPLKMQKLVYIAHGWYLALYDEPLVDDECAEAWEYGPVFPSIYHEFKHFGGDPIAELAVDLDYNELSEEWEAWKPSIDGRDKNMRAFLNHIWKLYKGFTGGQLSALTHEEGTPWEKTRNKKGRIRNAHIENQDIKEYNKGRLK